ncbi:MAG: ABC transporter substrate-binding protein, partial [Microvirga sp.]
LAPLIGTHDPAVLGALQAGFRVGTPDRWSEAERQAASDLYAILVRIGADKLVGSAKVLDVKTFWPPVSY